MTSRNAESERTKTQKGEVPKGQTGRSRTVVRSLRDREHRSGSRCRVRPTGNFRGAPCGLFAGIYLFRRAAAHSVQRRLDVKVSPPALSVKKFTDKAERRAYAGAWSDRGIPRASDQ